MKQSFPSQIEAMQQFQESLTTELVKTIKYWFRVDSCYAMEKWGIDREAIVAVLKTLSNQDIVKYDFHHQDGNASVLVFHAWLLPSLGIDAFAYLKVGLVYNHREAITEIQVLSFKEQDETLVLQLSDSEFADQQEEIRASWLQVQPEFILEIDPQNVTAALVDCALDYAPELLLQLGLPWVTRERVFAAVYSQPELAFDLPSDLLSPALLLHVTRCYPAIVEQCQELITPQLVAKLVQQNVRTMLYLPKIHFQPLDYYQAAFQEPELIQYVPQSLLNNEFVDQILQRNPAMIAHLPRQMKTMERCLMAVTYDQLLFEYVPRHVKTKVQQFLSMNEGLCA